MALEFDSQETVVTAPIVDETTQNYETVSLAAANFWPDPDLNELPQGDSQRIIGATGYKHITSSVGGYQYKVRDYGTADPCLQLCGARDQAYPIILRNTEPIEMDNQSIYTLSFDFSILESYGHNGSSYTNEPGVFQIFVSSDAKNMSDLNVKEKDAQIFANAKGLTLVVTYEFANNIAKNINNISFEIPAGLAAKYVYIRFVSDMYITFDNISLTSSQASDEDIIIGKTINLTAPVGGATPNYQISGSGYTGSVVWIPAVSDKFEYDTEYTATVTISTNPGFTTVGIGKDAYVVPGAKSVANAADSNVLTAKFNKTDMEPVGAPGDPGVNILTGTLSAYGFENTSLLNWVSSASLVTKEKDGNSANKAVKLNDGEHGQLNVAPTASGGVFDYLSVKLQNDRPYELVFKAMGNGTLWLKNRWHSEGDTIATLSISSASEWTEYSVSFTGDKTVNPGTEDNNNRIYFFKPSADTSAFYIDDISLVPHYKVTYDANGGTGDIEADYFYGSELTNLDNGLSVRRMGYRFVGWAESPTATAEDVVTKVVSTIAEDITLYAVWEKSFEGATDVYWNFESNSSKVWSAVGGYNGTYERGMYVVDTENATSGAYITHAALTGEAISTSSIDTFVIKVRSNGVSELTLSFTTTDNEDQTVIITGIETGSTFKEYSVDMSNNAAWTGNYLGSKLSVSGGSGTIEIDEMYYTSDYTYQEPEIGANDVEKAVLLVSADTITQDQGTITLTPYVRYGDGSELQNFSGVYYTIDSVFAQVKTNADGTATVTGKMNGVAEVTAVLKNGIKITKTIEISGQAERTSATKLKVMMFGNSILTHANLPGTWDFTDGRGMAATSLQNDYAHRFIYYINQKYGSGSAELVSTTNVAGFEGKVERNEDYTGYYDYFAGPVEQAQPDIITIQIGENINGATYEQYKTAMTGLYEAFHEAAPNALIIVATPFWVEANDISAMTDLAIEKGIPLAQLHTLDTLENKAHMHFPNASAGVKAHPGDVGMDNIAKLFFEQVNRVFSADEPTVYKASPESLEIIANSNVISKKNGTLQLTANILPTDASQEVIWSTSDTNIATVSDTGFVTAVNNGTVTITATSRFANTISDEYTVTVSGQAKAFTLTYNKNTTDTVRNMPEPNEYASEGFVFDEVYPVREGYSFLGWSDTPNGDIIKSLDVNTDTTVYAQWKIANEWYFETPGYWEEFTLDYAFNPIVEDGYIRALATGTDIESGEVLKFKSPALILDSETYHTLKINMQNSLIANDTQVKLIIKTSNGNVNLTKPVTTTDFTDYEFSLANVTGTITGFEIVPTNIDATIKIDSIEFLTYSVALDIASVKSDLALDVQSIRFAGFMTDEDKAKVDEFGFIIADASAFADGDNDYISLVHSNTNTFVAANGTYKYNSTAAYVKNGDDLWYSKTGEKFGKENCGSGNYYAVAVNNIAEEHFDSDIVVKTYVKIGDTYIYGTAVRKNVNEVIAALSANS